MTDLAPGFDDTGIDTFLTDDATGGVTDDSYLSDNNVSGDDMVLFATRSIGNFVADVTVEEEHTDELTITDHPVETGAAITDHAYRNPSRLVIRAGWSNSSNAATGATYVRDVYDALLNLQSDRQPFTVTTGKRTYDNMLIQGLAVTTDQTTENSLFLTCALREIIMVDTQSTNTMANAADPSTAGGISNGGIRQAVPVSSDLPGLPDDADATDLGAQ